MFIFNYFYAQIVLHGRGKKNPNCKIVSNLIGKQLRTVEIYVTILAIHELIEYFSNVCVSFFLSSYNIDTMWAKIGSFKLNFRRGLNELWAFLYDKLVNSIVG